MKYPGVVKSFKFQEVDDEEKVVVAVENDEEKRRIERKRNEHVLIDKSSHDQSIESREPK